MIHLSRLLCILQILKSMLVASQHFFSSSKLPLRGYIYIFLTETINFVLYYLVDCYISFFVPRADAVNRFNALSMLNFVGRF